jgi:hypothetical protein
VADAGQAHAGDEPHVSATDDSNVHNCSSPDSTKSMPEGGLGSHGKSGKTAPTDITGPRAILPDRPPPCRAEGAGLRATSGNVTRAVAASSVGQLFGAGG